MYKICRRWVWQTGLQSLVKFAAEIFGPCVLSVVSDRLCGCVCGTAVFKWTPDVLQLSISPAGRRTSQGRDGDVSRMPLWDQSYTVQSQPRRWEGNLRATGTVPVLYTIAAALDATETRVGDVPRQVRWALPRPVVVAIISVDVVEWLDVFDCRVVWWFRPCQVVACHVCRCLCSLVAGVVAAGARDVLHLATSPTSARQRSSGSTSTNLISDAHAPSRSTFGGQWTAFYRGLPCFLLFVCVSVCLSQKEDAGKEVGMTGIMKFPSVPILLCHACHLHCKAENHFSRTFHNYKTSFEHNQ